MGGEAVVFFCGVFQGAMYCGPAIVWLEPWTTVFMYWLL